jgi:hypothetical protein
MNPAISLNFKDQDKYEKKIDDYLARLGKTG